MTRVVWKQELRITDHQEVDLPRGAEVLYVGEQRGVLCAWFLCDPDAPPERRTLLVRGTGHSVGEPRVRHLGTAVVFDGALVWHVFEAI